MIFTFLRQFIGGKTELAFYAWLILLAAYLLQWPQAVNADQFIRLSQILAGFGGAALLGRMESRQDIMHRVDTPPLFGPLAKVLGWAWKRLIKRGK